MDQKVELNKESTAVLLFSKKEHKWIDGTKSISAVFTAYYYGKFTGCNIYFNGTGKHFFYKKDSVQFLHKVENRLYDFVTNKELLNVAISRGRRKVTAIVAENVYRSSINVINDFINDFIKYAGYLYGSDTTRESRVTSVFDVLYSEYTNTLLSKYKERPEKHTTELLMCDIISQVLKHHSYIGYSMHTRLGKLVTVPETFSDEERRYILHPWTHVDFLFHNNISKEKLFVLEVDGIRYHEQDKKQAEHDDIKNRVLRANNIPIFRFKTNESNEKGRLTEIIEGFSH